MFSTELLESALAPFADPATEVRVVATSGGSCAFSFTRKGQELTGRAVQQGDEIWIDYKNVQRQRLASFLASADMADLDELARVQCRVYERAQISSKWVAGPALIDEHRHEDSLSALEANAQPVPGRTRVVILDGPAGMGKTTLAQRMAAQQAQDFINRRRTSLTLIVSSRGRKLSRLNDAIAATLQDFRVALYYPEVPVLVRHGLLTLVIDGFDELVNQEGYNDAWYSLTELLDGVAGGGVLVLSSRDTFFSDQEFVQRAQRHDPMWEGRIRFSFIRLLPWSRSQVKALFGLLGVSDDRAEVALDFLADARASALVRPFFARHLADKIREGQDVDLDRLLFVIIQGFVEREAKLLFADLPSGQDILRRFFRELALEMRQQEREGLELDVVQFFLDAVLEEAGLPDESRRQLIHRAGAVAFLDIQEGSRQKRGFPHQIIRDFFFAEYLLNSIGSPPQLESAIRLGVFGLDLADVLVEIAEILSIQHLGAGVRVLFDIAGRFPSTEPIAMNAASLGFALLRVSSLGVMEPIRLTGLHVGNVSLAGATLPEIELASCSVGFLDLSDTMAARLTVKDTAVARLRVSSGTALGKGWQCIPQAVEEFGDGAGLVTMRTPNDMKDVLWRLGAPLGESESLFRVSEGEALLDALARRWVRRFYLWPNDLEDEPAFGSPLWPRLRAVLEHYDRLMAKVPATSGPRRELLHLKDPSSLLRRRHPDSVQQRIIDEIWSAARAL